MGTQRPSKDEIFNAAAEIDDLTERAAYLEAVCSDEPQLRAEIEDLLQRDLAEASFLESPPPGLEDTLLHTPREEPGDCIGPYKLLQEIGEGGFGVVYMAEQEEPVRRRVALKLIKPGMDTRQVIARFEAERQALALMDHPNIARVLDAGATDSGRPYFVMELVKGTAITDYCDQNNLSPPQRLELFLTVCRAVQHAHQKGIIHRDIKPSNVLVTLHDGEPVVKVIDFGVAKAINQRLTEKTMFTNFGQMIGTPLYMSPEQAAMSGLDVDTRTDIYSLGVLLYELLTGTTPFELQRLQAAGFDEIRRIIREEEPPKPSLRISTLGDTLPSVAAQRHTEPKKLSLLVRGDLDWIVMRSLEKDRTRRYETANGLARDIERFLNDEAVEASPPSAGYRFSKFARRNKVAIATVSLVLAVVIFGLLATTWQAVRATTAEQLAQQNLKQANEQRDLADQQRQRAEAETQAAELARQREQAEHERADENFRRARQAVDDYFTAISQNELLDEAGMEPLRKELLEAALKYYEGFAQQQSDDPQVLSKLAAAHHRIAQIQAATGSTDWPDAYGRCLDIVERLHREHSDTSRWAGSLVGVFNYRSTEAPLQPGRAMEVFRRGIELYGQLVEAHPRTSSFQEELAMNYFVLAMVQTGIGWLEPTAISNFQQARAIWERLVQDAPEQPRHIRHLAWLYVELTKSLDRAGRGPAAESVCRDAVELFRRVPGEEGRMRLADAISFHAMRLRNANRHREAEPLFREALQIIEDLLSREQKTPRSRPELRWFHGLTRARFAELLIKTGRPAEAESQLRQAIAIYEELARQDSDNEIYFPALKQASLDLGALLIRVGRFEDAKQHCVALKETFENLASEFPDQPAYRTGAGHMHLGLASAYADAKRYEDAEAEYRQASRVFRQAAVAFPNLTQPGLEEGRTYWRLGEMFRAANRYDESEQALLEALSVFEQLSTEFPNEHNCRWEWGFSHWQLGWTLDAAQRFSDAEEHWRAGVRVYAKALHDFPGDAGFQKRLAQSHNALAGNLIRQAKRVEQTIEELSRGQEHVEAYATYQQWLQRVIDAARSAERGTANQLVFRAAITPNPGRADSARQTEAGSELVAVAEAHVAQKPYNAQFYRTLGAVYLRAGDWQKALNALVRSNQQSAGKFLIQNGFLISIAYRQAGDRERARRWFDAAEHWRKHHKAKQPDVLSLRQQAGTLLGVTRIPAVALKPEDDTESELLKLVIRANPDAAWAWENLGHAHRQHDRLESAQSAFARAEELYSQRVEEKSDDPAVFQFRARFHSRLGDHAAAIVDWSQAINLEPNNLWPERQRTTAQVELGQWKAAAEGFSRISRDSDDVILWYWRALTQLGAGLDGDYRETCALMLERFGNTTNPSVGQWVAWTCGLAPDAADDLTLAIVLGENGVGPHTKDEFYIVSLGAVLYRAGRFDEALDRLSAADLMYRDDGARSSPAYTWYFLGMTYHALGQTETARMWLERADEWAAKILDSTENPPLWNRGLTLRLLRDEAQTLSPSASPATTGDQWAQLDQTVVYYARALRSTPQSKNPWWGRIVGANTPAIEDDEVYARLVDLFPQHRGLRIARVFYLASQSRWDELSEVLESVIELEPNDDWGWYHAAAVALYRGEFDSYCRICNEFVNQFDDSDDPRITTRVARTCLLSPDNSAHLQLARQLAERAVTTGSDYKGIHWFHLAQALAEYRAGDFDKAVDAAQKSRAHGRNEVYLDATSWLVQAMACHKAGRTQESVQSLRDAYALMNQFMPPKRIAAKFKMFDWLRFEILRRETEALILADDAEVHVEVED